MSAICNCCQKPKAQLECGLCQSAVCKPCAHILEENAFSFLSPIPEDLGHSIYCHSCFVQKVDEPFQEYNRLMELAKNVDVFFKEQSKETRLLQRRQEPVKIKDCEDEQETLLRLAFLAAQAGFNGLIDVEIKGKKVRNGAYQTTLWNGVGLPTQVKKEKLLRDRSLWQNPN